MLNRGGSAFPEGRTAVGPFWTTEQARARFFPPVHEGASRNQAFLMQSSLESYRIR